ncbi:glycosyltransferase family 4 protein [Microbacterium sp. Root180]|uniref:glycosyltransferase family 4 protein n=1 Tax=Microbacterium sp. Root180 TaxID=1736483 RepID=UPI0009E93847|nr:glycosyltransferase family 4 protein [Microbacterium sp. Root180]
MSPRPARSLVLLATRTYPPEVNAAAFRLGALARALARHAEVSVVTSTPAKHAPPIRAVDGVEVRRLPVLRDRGGNVRGYVQYMSFDVPLFARLITRRFSVAVAEAPPTTGVVTAVVAALRRRPFAYYAADVWSDGVAAVGAPRVIVGAMRMLERFVLGRAAAILSVSEGVNERLAALGTDLDRVTVVGHGVDTSVFAPDGPRTKGDPFFVYTGTMSEVHRPQVLIEAFASIAAAHPNLTLRFFGQGVYEEELRDLSERLVPGRVHFGGVIAPEEAAQRLRGAVAALVTLAPGTGYEFAHPTKAYAAAACGTPVLYAGPDEFGAIIRENGLGIAVDHDVRAVAASMQTLLGEWTSGHSERERPHRARWAADNVSLDAVGARAAAAVLALAGPQVDEGRIDQHSWPSTRPVQEPPT